MEKSAIDLKGLITKKDGEYFTTEEFFEKLESIGYTFEGGYDFFEEEKMNKAIKEIKQSIDEKTVQNMMDYLKEKHDEQDLEDFQLFLSGTTGTGTFEQFIKSNLNKELIVLYNKYSNSNWQISDVFEARIADVIFEKMKENMTK